MGMHPRGISCGAPADFANLAALRSWHISSPKIAQLRGNSQFKLCDTDFHNFFNLEFLFPLTIGFIVLILT